MFIIPSIHWDEFLGYVHRIKLDDDRYYTPDDVVQMTRIIKRAIVPLKPGIAPDVYPSRQYFDLYTELMDRLERKNSLANFRPELYISPPTPPVAPAVYAKVLGPLYRRMESRAKSNGHSYLKNIFSLHIPEHMTDIIKLMYVLYRATDYYYSKITPGG